MSALLEGRTAIVTGAAQGIGLAIATTLVGHGARVTIADLDGDKAAAAAAGIGPAARGVACDVTDEASVAALVSGAVAEYGGLDVIVNNAGITRDASLKKMTLENFQAVITVHLQGTWLGIRAASEVMREAKSGSIINISSMSGKSGNPGQTNYSAAKAGIVGMTKAAAKELAHHGVRVNAIQPGLIRTPMTEGIPDDLVTIPLGRPAESAEVATFILFLASDESSYATGSEFVVDGGLVTGVPHK